MPGPIKVSRGSAASLKRTLVVDTIRGVPRIRTWPGPQTEATKAKTAIQREWFRQAQWGSKFVDAGIQQMARVLTDGTPLMPRDVMTMAMAGRFLGVRFPGGKVLLPLAFKNDVSNSLDVLSSAPGSILARGPDIWEGIPPLAPGWFLMSQGADQAPKWATAPQAGTKRVGLHLTSNAAVGTASYYPSWGAADFDDMSMWSASDPTNVTAPADGRIQAEILFQCSAGAIPSNAYLVWEIDGAVVGASNIGGVFAGTAVLPWMPISAGQKLRQRLECQSGNRTMGAPNTKISVSWEAL